MSHNGCGYLTDQRPRIKAVDIDAQKVARGEALWECLYYPGWCKKPMATICPILDGEVQSGELEDQKRLQLAISKMPKDYFIGWFLSMSQNQYLRTVALKIYAGQRGLTIHRRRDHERLSDYIKRMVP